jgi:hypothetical protein
MQLVEGLMPQKSRRSPPLALKRSGRSEEQRALVDS